MKKGKKTIRLTESEMVSMIERIVNEVKREKRNQVNESTYVRKRYLMESEEEILTAELEEMDENNPDPTIFNKIESLAKKLGKLPMKISRKLKILKRKHPKMFKNKAGKTTTDCMELNESYFYNKKRL
jgi:molybdopterin-biosynthesis enzyme MoeA-like protein